MTRRWWTGAAVAAVVAGCAQLPADEARVYVDAFAEVRGAADVFYDDAAKSLAVLDAAKRQALESPGATPQCPAPPPDTSRERAIPRLFPEAFEPTDFLRRPEPVDDPPDIAARRLALATVARYNQLLASRASGATATALAAEVTELGRNVTALAGMAGVAFSPLANVALGLLGEAVEAAGRAQAAEEVRKLLAGGAAPVRDLIRALIDDTRNLYRFHRNRVRCDLLLVQFAVDDADIELASIGRAYRPPAPGSDLANGRARVEAEASAMTVGVGLPASSLVGASGGPAAPALTDDAVKQMQGRLPRLAAAVGRYREMATSIAAYHAALAHYVGMLEQVEAALGELETAALRRRPPDLARLAARAAVIQTRIGDVRAALNR